MVLGNFGFIFLLGPLLVMLVSSPHLLYQESQCFSSETISEGKQLQSKSVNIERKLTATGIADSDWELTMSQA